MARTGQGFRRKTTGSLAFRALACSLIVAGAWTSNAVAAIHSPDKEIVLTCRIEGQDRQASVSLTDSSATYSYGPPDSEAELTLSSRLVDLDYRRNSGAAGTVDETVAFANGDTTYRFAARFRNGIQPDPTALHPFGLLTVSRSGRELARLPCDPASIERAPDRPASGANTRHRAGAGIGRGFVSKLHYSFPGGGSGLSTLRGRKQCGHLLEPRRQRGASWRFASRA